MSSTYPYTAKATVKYKSPHATDLSFAKGETIRVTGVSDDDEDWLLGESLDGSRVGGFPRDFVEQVDEPQESVTAPVPATTTQQEVEPPAPVMKSAEPPSQPLPEADAIPGSFNPEPVREPQSEPLTIVEPLANKVETSATPVKATLPSAVSSPAPHNPTSIRESNAETLSSDTPEPSKLSFKDRLAAFNKPKDAPAVGGARGPPPALKPKPAGAAGLTWSQRQKLREEEEKRAKESGGSGEMGQVIAQLTSVSETSAVPPAASVGQVQSSSTTTSAEEKTGMSASDAKASIGLSLKERMAALQGSQAFGGTGAGTAPASDDPTSPSETTGKKPSARTWKRPEAEEGSLPLPGQMPMPGMGRSNSARSTEGVSGGGIGSEETGEVAAGDAGEGVQTGEEGEDEEQKEKERRAAIAARMARLGGRGMFGGPPPLAPKPGGPPKPAAIDTQTTSQSADLSSSPVDQQRSAEPITSPVQPQPTSADQVAAPGGGIAMPAIPRRAAGPRRRGGAAAPGAGPSRSESQMSGTGSEQVTSPITEAPGGDSPQIAKETPAAPEFVSTSAGKGLTTAERNEERILEEQAGAGIQGAEGAEAAGIALAPAPVHSQPPADEKADEGNLGGQDVARHGDGPVLIGAEGGADSEDRGTLNEAVLQGGSARMPSMPPPPPPPGGFDSDEDAEQSDDDGEDDLLREAKSGQMHAQPSRIDVEEGLPRQPEEDEQDLSSPRSPVAFAPLQSPAVDHPEASTRQHMTSPSSANPGNSALASLGLPRDEIEMKHEHEAEEQAQGDEEEDEDDDAPPPPPRADRPADKPSGPRPMPNPPVLGQTAAPEQVMQSESQGDEIDGDEPTPAPPPRRRDTLERPTQVGVALPSGSKDVPQDLPVSNPPIVSEEPISAVVNDESARRQNIAARMAKLGGIKLGGPPMFNSRQASESTDKGLQSPTEMPQTPLSPIGDDPLSPTSPAMSRNAGLETTGDDDETDEAAAHRRRATLARLQAGGHLGGFNMFSRNVEPQSPTVEINNMESVPQTPVPRIDERNLQAEEEVVDEYPTGPEVADADVVPDIEDLDEAPPPPPRRPEQLASPPLSPHGEVPVSPLLVRSGTLRSSSSQQSAGTGLPEAPPSAGLAAPIPAGITSMVSEEPQPMSRLETVENEDEVGPPPPPRIDTAGPPAHQRSDSRASRISIGSRHSSQAVPVSPTTPRRTSMQTGRPAYNELQQASSTFGSKVYRAAQKMADTGRRQSIGDGSSRAFVWTALGEAGIDANNSFGTLIWEQEGPTQNKRYDDIRVGDVIVLHDAKLKGKKGLVPYNQQVGSVEEPMFAICSETEQKKNKVKVWQVDRGHIASESYRLEDLQSGLVRAFRPM